MGRDRQSISTPTALTRLETPTTIPAWLKPRAALHSQRSEPHADARFQILAFVHSSILVGAPGPLGFEKGPL